MNVLVLLGGVVVGYGVLWLLRPAPSVEERKRRVVRNHITGGRVWN